MSRIQITESKLQMMAEHIRNNFGRESTEIGQLLKRGETFKETGLTPFYILSEETSSVFVTSLEAMDGKLN